MINPIASSFENCPRSLIEAAHTFGKSKWETIQKVIIPFSKLAILSATIMTFCTYSRRIWISSNDRRKYSRQTKLASIAIYQEVEMLTMNPHTFSLFLF